ncbi:MAG TPA: glycosyltransferase family 2 protein [Acidiferrobacteraceae bacterium]|nr:glycosyltransferase family 2 protein [Acidiferrobacteraceae bacterium]
MSLDVLIPTCARAGALAVTLMSLSAQTQKHFRIVISDQTQYGDVCESREVLAVIRLLRAQGRVVQVVKHLPKRGMAEQRQFLLDQARAEYVLFVDDDVLLEPDLVTRLLAAIARSGAGFVGSAVIGLSYLNDVRPHEQAIEYWDGPVLAERITPDDAAWQRHRLHNAANLYHVQQRSQDDRLYKVAWVGGCVLYRTEALRATGGFLFWRDLPEEHCGEDVLAQLRVMARFGGAGLLPSGAYHQELPTTVRSRKFDAVQMLIGEDASRREEPADRAAKTSGG